VDIENLKMIAGAASIKGPAGTTAYLILPACMTQLRQDLALLIPRDYTVFCRDKDGTGTTYITHVEKRTLTDAKANALKMCAEDWEQDQDTIEVLGVLGGDVEIIEWEDE
jgi:hypothetical protein